MQAWVDLAATLLEILFATSKVSHPLARLKAKQPLNQTRTSPSSFSRRPVNSLSVLATPQSQC